MLYVIMISNRARLTISRIIMSKHNIYIYKYTYKYIYIILSMTYDNTADEDKLAERENLADRQRMRRTRLTHS